MTQADPASTARAVRAVRIFLPIYLAGVLTLLLPALARISGAELPLLSVIATASLGAMAVGAPLFLAWLGREGHYDGRKGMRFRLGAALFRNVYVPVDGQLDVTRAASPLGSTARDAAKAATDLEAAGLDALARTLRAVVSEGEVALLGAQRVRTTDPPLAAEAEHALARLRDQVTRVSGPSPGDPAVVHAELEDLLRALRGVNDRLRAS